MRVQDLLLQWGAWSSWSSVNLSPTSILGVILDRCMGGGLPTLPFNDLEMGRVDIAVAQLKRQNKPLYRVVRMHYRENLSTYQIAAKLGYSQSTAQRRLLQAENIVETNFLSVFVA